MPMPTPKETFQEEMRTLDLAKMVNKDLADVVYKLMVFDALTVDELKESPATLNPLMLHKRLVDVLDASTESNKQVGLAALRYFPVSMCAAQVTDRMRLIIGFFYRLCNSDKQALEDGVEKISYDDLSEIFGRSKSTISDCVTATEEAWQHFLAQPEVDRIFREEKPINRLSCR